MNVFFAGTPACAIPALSAITQVYPLAGVLTAPPARVGRGNALVESAVACAVAELKRVGRIAQTVPVLTYEALRADFRAAVAELHPDILVCFAYGKIFGPKALALFPKGALNIHPSLLPRWRGPSPVPAALLAGDTVTGVTIQYMAQDMDAGDIVLQEVLPIEHDDTAETLLSRCAERAPALILRALKAAETDAISAVPQNHAGASYCTLLQKDSGLLNWSDSACTLDRKIRAYTPWPGAFTYWNNMKLSIIQAHPYRGNAASASFATQGIVLGVDKQDGLLIQTGEGILAVQILQKATKKAMLWKDFLNGASDIIGARLTAAPFDKS